MVRLGLNGMRMVRLVDHDARRIVAPRPTDWLHGGEDGSASRGAPARGLGANYVQSTDDLPLCDRTPWVGCTTSATSQDSRRLGLIDLTGPAGPPGVNGTNGVNGLDGMNGLNGTNGVNGLNGTNGVNGTDGPRRLRRHRFHPMHPRALRMVEVGLDLDRDARCEVRQTSYICNGLQSRTAQMVLKGCLG